MFNLYMLLYSILPEMFTKKALLKRTENPSYWFLLHQTTDIISIAKHVYTYRVEYYIIWIFANLKFDHLC